MMSDGVYTRGGWAPLPENEQDLHAPHRFRGFVLVGALLGLLAGFVGLAFMRPGKRRGDT